ncbi:LysR family transcriptional regulator substrate-binding protein [Paenibacillus alkalitolerans]|uniref:LysR family transcriptional regulator substrate-binding protein n=1 Tax=Paenibacillus alkalitolerans TaxID=2799335 RepID=UPI001F296002|nr:LysR family transcriptional regulator substrate-binding protein [Paenibacillus alkalitolerans]
MPCILVTAAKGYEIGTVRIRVIREKHPGLKFEFYEGTIDEIKEWLSSRVIDVGWIIPPNDGFEIVPFYNDDMCL